MEFDSALVEIVAIVQQECAKLIREHAKRLESETMERFGFTDHEQDMYWGGMDDAADLIDPFVNKELK